MRYEPGLNEVVRLADRVAIALHGAKRLDIGVAYAKASGVSTLLRLDPPKGSRAVVGLGFGITDPIAVEQLEDAGVEVRLVQDSAELSASQFHPKLYLVERPSELRTFSTSANLTGAGWTTNVEQFEELTFAVPSEDSDRQRERYELVWEHGEPLNLLRRTGDWEEYRARARDRRRLEREDRARVLKVQARTGRLVGQLARRVTRGAPGYVAITNDEWWELQLQLRDQSDRALFWRRNVKDFKALAQDGLFFHLVKDATVPEELRAVRGYSVYRGDYEVGDARAMFRRYGAQLGVTNLFDLYRRLELEQGDPISIIHLEELSEFDRPVTLEELRANGVAFAPNIVAGRRLSIEEIATLLELGGLGVEDELIRTAAEGEGEWRPSGGPAGT